MSACPPKFCSGSGKIWAGEGVGVICWLSIEVSSRLASVGTGVRTRVGTGVSAELLSGSTGWFCSGFSVFIIGLSLGVTFSVISDTRLIIGASLGVTTSVLSGTKIIIGLSSGVVPMPESSRILDGNAAGINSGLSGTMSIKMGMSVGVTN